MPKLAVNYSLAEGKWTLAVKANPAATDADNLVALLGKKPKERINTDNFVKFEPQNMPATKEQAKAGTWFVKVNAADNKDGTYTAASKAKKFAAKVLR